MTAVSPLIQNLYYDCQKPARRAATRRHAFHANEQILLAPLQDYPGVDLDQIGESHGTLQCGVPSSRLATFSAIWSSSSRAWALSVSNS
jgi:hypothetical protein